jgi:HlyD family secretion protein
MSPRSIGRWHEPEDDRTGEFDQPSSLFYAGDPSDPSDYNAFEETAVHPRGGGHRRAVAAGSGLGAGLERLRESALGWWSTTVEMAGPGVRDAVGPGATPAKRWVVALSVVVPVALVGVACASQAVAPTTAKVTKAAVTTKVTGTGSLRSITEQKLGFDEGGKISEVDVTVGQKVTRGQVLARVDDFSAKAAQRKAQAALDKEQAALDALKDSKKVDASSEDADGAEDVVAKLKEQSDQIDKSNDKAVEDAERQVAQARTNLRRVQADYDADSTRCSKSVGGDTRTKPGEVHQPNGLAGELHVPSPVESAACDRARQSEAQVAEARSGVAKAQQAASQARRQRNLDHAEQQVSIQSAKRDSKAAQMAAEDAEAVHPRDIEQQEAAVADAQTEVDVAARDIEDTVLRAPVDGKVAAINGTVGEYVGGGSGTTAQSPGSRAALPDVDSESSGSTNSSNSKSERPGGGSFMVLNDISTFQVVVPFEESDAAQVQPNQEVDVSFDSVPGLTRKGTVVSVSPTGTTIQDVTNYYATIVLNEFDPRLKDGQTAQASVVVGKSDESLTIPSAAVQQAGGTGLVTILTADGEQRQVQVELGMTGDGVVQVLSGLKEGQTIVVPDA